MASNALSAFGTLLKAGNGASPESFATIAELRTISGPTIKADTIDVTVHNTPTPWRRFISGLLDGGEVTFDINFIPTDDTHDYNYGILHLLVNRVRRNFQIVFPDAGSTTWLLPTITTGFQMSSHPAEVLMASVTLKVAGPPSLS